MVEDAFAIPIYKKEGVVSLMDDERKWINSLTYNFAAFNNNYFSVNYDVLDGLPRLKEIANEQLLKFKDEVCCFKQELYITDSWIAKTLPGGMHSEHEHPNSLFSAVMYLQTPRNNPLNFYRTSDLNRDFRFVFDYTKPNKYNRSVYSVDVKEGDVVIFPSWLMHYVDTNTSNTERIVLAFNTFARGDFTFGVYPNRLKLV